MNNAQFCPFCQRKNASDATHCAFCGVALGEQRKLDQYLTTNNISVKPPELPHTEHARECKELRGQFPENTLVFMVEHHDDPLFVSITSPLFLGRGDDAMPTDVELVDFSELGDAALAISRRHAKIESSESGWSLTDLNSTNGTWLNNQRLAPNTQYPLQSGDKIWLGPLRITFCIRLSDPGTPSEPAKPAVPVQSFVKDEAAGKSPGVRTGATVPPPTDSAVVEIHLVFGEGKLQYPFALTPNQLLDTFAPYLQAITRLHLTLSELQNNEPGQLEIVALRAEAGGVVVKLAGAREVIETITKWIMPWRRRVLESSRLKKKTAVLQQLIFTLAQKMVNELLPDLEEYESSLLARKLLPELRTLLHSPLELRTSSG